MADDVFVAISTSAGTFDQAVKRVREIVGKVPQESIVAPPDPGGLRPRRKKRVRESVPVLSARPWGGYSGGGG